MNQLPSLAHTIYTQNTELFAEFRAMVVGDTTKLGGHFTRLGELFTPVTTGTITVSLIVGENVVSHKSTVSESPGIFRFTFVPAKPGEGKLVFDINNEIYTDQVVIDRVIVFPDKSTALASANEEKKGNEISYLKEQAWKVEFANAAIALQPFNEVIRTTGEILAAQGDEMMATANVSGIVFIHGKNSVPGTAVKSGETLFEIKGGNLVDSNAETIYKQAKASYDKAKADYDRALELTKENIVSQKEFLEIKAKFESEQAYYTNLLRNYQAGGLKVQAPLSGFLKNILVKEGEYVSAGQPLAVISQNRRLVLKADLSQKYASKLSLIQSANFVTEYSNKTYDLDQLKGSLLSFGKNYEQGSPFIPVTFSFENQGDFLPGTIADVFLKLRATEKSIVIPVSAIIEEQGSFFAYVQTAGESFVKRELTLGGADGNSIQVLKGLAEGERLVTRGAYQIKLATSTGTIPAHGHAH